MPMFSVDYHQDDALRLAGHMHGIQLFPVRILTLVKHSISVVVVLVTQILTPQ